MTTFAILIGTGSHAQDCCETENANVALSGSAILGELADTEAACCAVKDAAASGAPWFSADLRNAHDPISGEPTTPEYYLDYADLESDVFGRIYFSSKDSRDAAEEENLKELFENAFLLRKDGTYASYGKTRLSLNNTFCPVSGIGASATKKLLVNESMAVNCTAGNCSMGDGFRANFNGVAIGACCPSCVKMLVTNPENFLVNLAPEIEAALERFETAKAKEIK